MVSSFLLASNSPNTLEAIVSGTADTQDADADKATATAAFRFPFFSSLYTAFYSSLYQPMWMWGRRSKRNWIQAMQKPPPLGLAAALVHRYWTWRVPRPPWPSYCCQYGSRSRACCSLWLAFCSDRRLARGAPCSDSVFGWALAPRIWASRAWTKFAAAVPSGLWIWASAWRRRRLSLSRSPRPTPRFSFCLEKNSGVLVGPAWAFVGLHDAIASPHGRSTCPRETALRSLPLLVREEYVWSSASMRWEKKALYEQASGPCLGLR